MNTRLPLASLVILPLACIAVRAQTVRVVQTTDDLSQALAAQPPLEFAKAAPGSEPGNDSGTGAGGAPEPMIHVDAAARFQTMDGFGAAMTEGSAWLLGEKLSAAQRSRVMADLFDPIHGAGLSFLRLPIASTDLSRTLYSYDDMAEGKQDRRMKHFSAAKDEQEVFPLVREALRLNPALTVMATPWSPPAWMKTKPTRNGGQLRPEAEPAFASYLVRSVQSMQKSGIPVKFLSIQNEPLNETHDYPGTLLSAAQAKRLIGQDLGPALRKAGLSTQVLAYDHNWDHPEYPLEVLADPAARPFTAGSAMHCYGGKVAAQDGIHEAEPAKGIWMTECSGGSWQKESPLSSTAKLMIGSTEHWAKAVVLWGIALEPDGTPHSGGCGTCRALVTVDLKPATPALTYTGDYYALAQAARFVRPGAIRIGSSLQGAGASSSTGADGGLLKTAFQNTDGTIALLVFNGSAAAVSFTVEWSGSRFRAALPAGAVCTYSWTAPA